MKQFKLLNNVVGWLVFLVAAFTYVSTVESSASFWDCPEFITTAYRLEVGHPPGAPFFMLTGKFFSLFASGPEQVAYWINVMSALLSAFCILFLFWSITHLTRKLLCTDGVVETLGQTLTILASGVAGALAYTWSDTFWFSAVEGEVYAYSSMFTALVFWLILKWEDNADSPHADRWIVLIFYLTGLSIGVHLLNLLCLPAIVLVYYYKKWPDANLKGSLIALVLSVVLVAAVLYGVVPGIVKVGGWFELFFVNVVGLPFNSGMIIYILALIAVVSAALWSTLQSNRVRTVALYIASVGMLGIPFYGKGYVAPLLLGFFVLAVLAILLSWKKKGQFVVRKRALNTSLLCMLMLMIGYSSYALIVLRSAQNTPMDQNSPEDIFSLGTYLNREQYGQKPLLYGQAFTSQAVGYGKEESVQRHEKKNANEPDKYDIVEVSGQPVYPSAQKMLFPRMFSRAHAGLYQQWLGGIDTKPVDVHGEYDGQSYDFTGEMPSQWDNLRFFLSYQVNFMYWRYFMWNFAGRQNDLQGDGGLLRGGAATGIPFVDSFFYGDSDTHPEDMTANKGHNVYYALPLILGLIGLFFQIGRGRRGVESFWVTFMLFFMTGIAIVLYLNQYPGQPRERDYAYVGSFYAFSIWVGFGVAAIATTASRYLSKQPAKKTSDEDAPVTISTAAAGVASLVLLLIPIQMAGQNWDDHDRSGRTVASDMGRNYLESCEPNAILFCYGDNDTFPLWYAQEVEGIRTDVRTVNLSYLSGDWYIDQMKKQAYEGKPLPIGLLPKSYYYYNNYALVSPNGGERLSVEEAYKALQGHGPGSPAMLPSPDLYVAVDSVAVAQRIAKSFPALTGHITPDFSLSLHGRQFLDIGGLSVLDLIAGNKWERPIYWAITSPRNAFNGMTASMVQTGMASQLLPLAPRVDSTGRAIDYGIGNLDRMYETVMTKFRWCGADRPGTYFDENARGIVSTLRNQIFTPLANGYLERGDKQKAQAILKKCLSVILEENVPYETSALYFADALYRADMRAEADHVLQAIARRALSTLTWAVQLPAEKLEEVSRHGELQEAYTAISYALDFAKDYNSQALSRYEQEIAALLRRLGVAQ